MLSPSDIIVDL